MHHAHQRVEGRLTGRHEHVRDTFLAKGGASVGEVHEEVEGGGRLTVAVDSGPNPRVGAGHQVARCVLSETGRRVASPSQSVVEGHVPVHQRRVVDTVKRVGVGDDTTVAKAPKDDFPLGEFLAFGSEEQVVVVAGVAFENGPAHAFFIACGTEEEGLGGEQLLGRPHVGVDDGFLLQVVGEIGDPSLVLETVRINPRGAQHQVGVEEFGARRTDVAGSSVGLGVVRCWNFFPRTPTRNVGHEGLGVELVVLCSSDHGFHFVHQLDIRLVGQNSAGFLE